MIGLRKRLHQVFHPREELKAYRMLNAVSTYLKDAPAGNLENNHIIQILQNTCENKGMLASDRLSILMKVYGELPEGNFKSNLLDIISDAKDGRQYGSSQLQPVDFKSLSWHPDGQSGLALNL